MSVFLFACGVEDPNVLFSKNIAIPTIDTCTRSYINRYYMFTSTGYLDKEAFKVTIEEFCQIWQSYKPTIPCYLFGYQLSVHIDENLIANSKEKDVCLLCLRANTSHLPRQ